MATSAETRDWSSSSTEGWYISEQWEQSLRASRDEIEREAIGAGMKTLWDDGLSKVAAGLTSVEELARILV